MKQKTPKKSTLDKEQHLREQMTNITISIRWPDLSMLNLYHLSFYQEHNINLWINYNIEIIINTYILIYSIYIIFTKIVKFDF